MIEQQNEQEYLLHIPYHSWESEEAILHQHKAVLSKYEDWMFMHLLIEELDGEDREEEENEVVELEDGGDAYQVRSADENCGPNICQTISRTKILQNNESGYQECGKLQMRMEVDVPINPEHQCSVCSEVFQVKANLENHMTSHFKMKVSCNVCGQIFSKMSKLKKHWQVTGHKISRTEILQNNESGFKEHGNLQSCMEVDAAVNPEYRCNTCAKVFQAETDLVNHMSSHKMKVSCNVCGQTFSKMSKLKKHGLDHSDDPRRTHKCNTCNASFLENNALLNHLLRAHSGIPCAVCKEIFRTHTDYKDHKLNCGPKEGYNCPVCKKGFLTKDGFEYHMKFHSTKTNSFNCPKCDKPFRSKRVLRRHMLIHSSVRKHKCEICSKAFERPDKLKRHLLCHTTERQHECGDCSKAFSRRDHLKRHCLTHVLEPASAELGASILSPHNSCHTCKKNFETTFKLSNHRCVKDLMCSLCGKTFSRKSRLRAHQLNHPEFLSKLCTHSIDNLVEC